MRRSGSTTKVPRDDSSPTPARTCSMIASGSSSRGLSEVRTATSLRVDSGESHFRPLRPIAVAAATEDHQHPSVGAGQPARFAQDNIKTRRSVRVVDEDGERWGVRRVAPPVWQRDDLEPSRGGDTSASASATSAGSRPRVRAASAASNVVVHVDGARQRGRDPLTAPAERGAPRLQHDVAGVPAMHAPRWGYARRQ